MINDKTKNDIGNARGKQFVEVIRHFRRMGFEVIERARHEFCFNEMIIVKPSTREFNDLINKKGGNIPHDKTFERFLMEYFNLR